MASKSLTMKLLINVPSQKVLLAEAGKEVVDFLLSLLGMPLSTTVKLLTNVRTVGCIARLYRSLEELDAPYLQSKYSKAALLNPKVTSSTPLPSSLLLPATPAIASSVKKYYTCPKETTNYDCDYYVYSTNGYSSNKGCNVGYITSVYGYICPNCKNQMTREITYLDANEDDAEEVSMDGMGYVNGGVTYTIMDDLTISPMSSISSITLLNKFQVKDLSALEEITVSIGIEEGLDILKASLQSETVLTDTFLTKKRST